MIDTLSRVAWAAPLKRANSAEITESFLKEWILRWGPPKRILTDNASYFTCPYFAQFMAKFNTTLTHSAPWHPQGHAHIERFNRHIQQAIRLDQNPHDWDNDLEQILYNHNQAPHDTTGVPPLELLINRPTPPSIFMEDLLRDIQERREELEYKRQQALQRSLAQGEDTSRRQNRTRYPLRLKPGDFITIRTHAQDKLAPRFEGCYEIEEILGNRLTYTKNGRQQNNGEFSSESDIPSQHDEKGQLGMIPHPISHLQTAGYLSDGYQSAISLAPEGVVPRGGRLELNVPKTFVSQRTSTMPVVQQTHFLSSRDN
eukprot:Blabericola_migrator_1__5229@NODE_2691_length_2456_cov_12_999581_g1683_i0_p1_GENE_NODE_2691_length_2456_cov_12_999581_g1683_i0NODE_2691_length_2456_cov_12_999581_g1683_i0_p1_ORF_typecomplete_len314_score18_87rve/PF00665_26/1_2e18MLVIN_C/PF18697_1/0_00092DDE_2/PF02914_15/0_0022DDE_2/PF02914_15/2_3e03rve_3/PF13683_6/0_021_NODE_2691_length_2456_cov_12_999581_g1683_i08501791